MMKFDVELTDVYEDGALVIVESDDWIVAIPFTTSDNIVTIDTENLTGEKKWMAYDHLTENDESETTFCRGEDLDNALKSYEVAEKLNHLEAENKSLRECLLSARGYLDPSPMIQKRIDTLLA